MEKKPLSKVVGANLKREIRQSRYRTQENFAFEFGAETRTVNRWLNEGLRDVDMAEEIAEFLEIETLVLYRHILRSFVNLKMFLTIFLLFYVCF